MIFKKVILVMTTLLLFNAGCREKEELTLPVKVFFKVGISQEDTYVAEYLKFTNCQIGIESIQFEGKREAGGDVYFETDSKQNFQKLSFLHPTIVTVFDIPQGIYDYMRWDIATKCVDIENIIESNACVGIIISGNYISFNGSEIPFIFAIDALEQISARASDPEGKSKIVLSVNKEYEADVIFAPGNAFISISRESLEEAEISVDGEQPMIIISSNRNRDLYEILLYRIFQSISVTIR